MDFVRPVEAVLPGAEGRVLAVLAETAAELNLRTIAQLAGISPAQASRLLPALVELGVVERRDVPPAALFRLVPEHVAARALLALARSTDAVLDEMGRLAEEFAEAAASDLAAGRNIAATSLAILAGVNAADAVGGARLGRRAAGEDHDQVLALLRQAGSDGAAVERELRRLLPLETKAEYEPDDIARSVAAKAVERGGRCAAVARRVADRAR